LHAGIEMTINLLGHPMSVAQHYLAMNDTILVWLSTHLHHFQVIESNVLDPHCLCAVILVNSVVLRMSLPFLFEIEGSNPSERAK